MIINYLIYYGFILPVSRLPYFLLYRFSDLVYVVLYYILGYRHAVIKKNIYDSFPEKTDAEKKRIIKEFYVHFCDIAVESIKNFSITEKQVRARFSAENTQAIDKYYDQGKSVVTVGGHYGNWEFYAVSVALYIKHKPIGIYKPLSNTFFDTRMKATRCQFGLDMIPMKETKSYFQKTYERPMTIIFGADQWPSNPENAYWHPFLGRETPFHFGAEKYAKEFDLPVVYGEIVKEKRGHYKVIYHDLTDEPNALSDGEIISRYILLLEKTIREHNPAHWLWSHKRWKKTKEEVFGAKD